MISIPQQKKRVIGLDFDDVIIYFNTALLDFYKEKFNSDFDISKYHNVELHLVWGCTLEEELKILHDFNHSKHHAEALPVEGAIEALLTLKDYYEFVIITARPERNKQMVDDWLAKHFNKNAFKVIRFAKSKGEGKDLKSKSEICKELDVETFIDDSYRNAEEIALAGISVLLLDAPWNQREKMPQNISRVFSWKEILTRLP